MKTTTKTLSPDHISALLQTVKTRFDKNKQRHKGIEWIEIEEKLQANPDKLWTLDEMEVTGGEPDVIGKDKKTGEIIFCDCSVETPKDRRSLCYDRKALDARKANKPVNSAKDLAEEMGVAMMTEAEYQALQQLGAFDLKTSSWLETPPEVRKLGGAIFGDRRFDRVFIYHNGAESYYAARGFRGILKI